MNERYAELGDKAQEQAAQSAEDALAAVRRRLEPQQHPNFDGQHCIDCAAQLPYARRAAGRIRCVPCQEAEERLTNRRK